MCSSATLRLDVCFSRQQPIYRLAKRPADCQQHGGASFLVSASIKDVETDASARIETWKLN